MFYIPKDETIVWLQQSHVTTAAYEQHGSVVLRQIFVIAQYISYLANIGLRVRIFYLFGMGVRGIHQDKKENRRNISI